MPPETAPAAAGSEGTPAPQIPVTDDVSAGRALEGLLQYSDGSGAVGDDVDTESDAEEASDAGPDESEATGEEEGEGEPQEQKPAAIEPPNSWSAEHKAVFAKLPPETQAIIAQRESERDRVVNERTQEIANERKGWEAERQAIADQRTQYLNSLQQMGALLVPEAKQLSEIDWVKLAAENPAEFVQRSAQRDALRERFGSLQGEIQRVTQVQQAEVQKQQQAFRDEQVKLLAEKVPEFADAAKGRTLATEVASWLSTKGFTQDEVNSVVDHRLIAVAVSAMRAEKATHAAAAAHLKRNNPAPNVQAPGASQNGEDTAAKRMRDKITRFGRTNDVRDAASILESLL